MSYQTVVPRFSSMPGEIAQSNLSIPIRVSRLQRFLGYSFIKYILDVCLCILVLPFALPIMAMIAIAIRLDSDGPALFIQERIGRGGHHFRMFKFRTLRKDHTDTNDREYMRVYIQGNINRRNGSTKPTIHKPFEESQITRVGRILRKTSLDELPQIFNVLHGEMSVVGPRPNVPWEVDAYRFWHIERLETLPGITGLAQVRGRSGLAFNQIARYDIEYVRHKSLWLDIKILWWTVLTILDGRGAG